MTNQDDVATVRAVDVGAGKFPVNVVRENGLPDLAHGLRQRPTPEPVGQQHAWLHARDLGVCELVDAKSMERLEASQQRREVV